MKNVIFIVIALFLVGVGFLLGKNSDKKEVLKTEPVSDENYEPMLREFTLDMTDYSFGAEEIRVRKGDTVRITLNNVSGFHNFVINEFSIKSSEIKEGNSEVIEFVADKVGTFEYYCGIGDHRLQGMRGKLIID